MAPNGTLSFDQYFGLSIDYSYFFTKVKLKCELSSFKPLGGIVPWQRSTDVQQMHCQLVSCAANWRLIKSCVSPCLVSPRVVAIKLM